MAMLIKASGEIIKNIDPANGNDFSLEELREHVSCEFVQMIYLKDDRIMWLDEYGKMKDHVCNDTASLLLWEAGGGKTDYIAGDAFICKKGEVL